MRYAWCMSKTLALVLWSKADTTSLDRFECSQEFLSGGLRPEAVGRGANSHHGPWRAGRNWSTGEPVEREMAPPIGPSGCPYRVPSKNTIVSDSRRANWCCNSPAWYSLRLNSRPSELPSIKSTNYEKSQLFGRACVYGQVIKTRRNDRVVRVERRAVIGAGRLKQALRESEDSVTLNTSFHLSNG